MLKPLCCKVCLIGRGKERESSQDGDGVGVKPLCWVICRKYKWSRKSKLNHKQKRCADGLV